MQNPQSQTVPEPKRLDWTTMVVPFLLIIILCLCFPGCARCIQGSVGKSPELSRGKLRCRLSCHRTRHFSSVNLHRLFRYGTIRLGKPDEKPLYSNFAWGSMMFTSGLAADILFYSLCEWVLYANDPHLAEMGSIQDWASTYPLFHWGPIPWGFYVVLAAAFGFMLHVRGCHKQKYSEACRPILGKHTDGLAGTLIDLMAVFALLAGTTTTFTLATPLMSQDRLRTLRIQRHPPHHHRDSGSHLPGIHRFRRERHEGHPEARGVLRLPLLRSSGVCAAVWR